MQQIKMSDRLSITGEGRGETMTENIEVFTRNSIRIRSRAGTVYIDPFQMREKPQDADFILITHDHYDHFSPEDIAKVSRGNSILVVPEKMESKAQEVSGIVGQICTVKPCVRREIDGLEFETVPAYNVLKPFHPKSAEWVGYILRTEGKRIYIAGDTDLTEEIKEVQCDIALVPIGGTYTMDAKKAAELINIIRPDVTIPTHYGSRKDAEVFAGNVNPAIKVEVKMLY